MNRIENKHALITGASAGFGEAIARLFAAQGARLTLWARRGDRLERLGAELEKQHGVRVRTDTVDVRDRDAVARVAGEINAAGETPDVLVNNAGLASGFDPLHEGDFEDWDRMIDTNIKGLLNVTRFFLPAMVTRDSGHIVNVGSVAGHMAYPKGNVYNATKFAVRGLTDAINIDLFGTKIRVSSVDPGAAETEFSEVRFHGDKERAKATYDGFTPLTAEDVAEAVAFVVNAPAHVNISNVLIMPTDQRNPYLINRKGM